MAAEVTWLELIRARTGTAISDINDNDLIESFALEGYRETVRKLEPVLGWEEFAVSNTIASGSFTSGAALLDDGMEVKAVVCNNTNARKIAFKDRIGASNANSVYKATTVDPVWYETHDASTSTNKQKITIIPTTLPDTHGATYEAIDYKPALTNFASGTSVIRGLKDKYTVFVILYASIRVISQRIIMAIDNPPNIPMIADISETLGFDASQFAISAITTNVTVPAFVQVPDSLTTSATLPTGVTLTVPKPPSFAWPTIPDVSTFEAPPATIQTALDKCLAFIESGSGVGGQDGIGTTSSVQTWLEDEDIEMAGTVLSVIQTELSRAQSIMQKWQIDHQKISDEYSQSVNKFSQEVEKKKEIFNNDMTLYQADLTEKLQLLDSEIRTFETELGRDRALKQSEFEKQQAEMAGKRFDLERLMSDLDQQQKKVNHELSRFQNELNLKEKEYQVRMTNYSNNMEKEFNTTRMDLDRHSSKYTWYVNKLQELQQEYNGLFQIGNQQ